MIRLTILFLLGLGLLLAILPFAASSLYLDQRGVTISGHVYSKDEWIVTHDSDWQRRLDVTVEYEPPQEPGVAFRTFKVDAEYFDNLRKGDPVSLRYLRRQDIPQVPGAKTLRQMHMLPTVRLADETAWTGFRLAFGPHADAFVKIIFAVVLVLIVWRTVRLPFFGWAVAVCVLAGLGVGMVHDFPTPTPAPVIDVRGGAGVVKSVERVKWLWRTNRQRGFEADQPIQVVAVQFIPDGRTEPVVAVDLIDADSVPGLSEHGQVSIDYEKPAPRTAWIRGAGRQFARKNLLGIAVEIGASLMVIIVLLFAASLLGKGYRRLTKLKGA